MDQNNKETDVQVYASPEDFIELRQWWMKGLYNGFEKMTPEEACKILFQTAKSCAINFGRVLEKKYGRMTDLDSLIERLDKDAKTADGYTIREGNVVRQLFKPKGKCICPLVQKGFIELHPYHSLCSIGSMIYSFEFFTKQPIVAELVEAPCWGHQDEILNYYLYAPKREVIWPDGRRIDVSEIKI